MAMISRRRFFQTVAGGAAAFLSLGSYAFGFEPLYRLEVRRYDLALPQWPLSAKPLTVAIVADIHAVDPWMSVARIEEIVDATNALNADIVLLLGDYVRSMRLRRRTIEPDEWAAPLGRLRAPLGVHAVLGNHDYAWARGPKPVQAALEKVGIAVYVNRTVKIDRDGHRFWLSGTTSILSGNDGPGIWGGLDDLKATLGAIDDDAPVIHMAHEPDMFPHIPKRVALTLSGHTHGGQIYIPGIGRPILNSAYGERYVYGHIVEDGRHLLVSAGLGCSFLPIRFMVPPEIVLARITPGLSA